MLNGEKYIYLFNNEIQYKSWKMIENTTDIYEKLEKEISDLMRSSITFFSFSKESSFLGNG